MVLKNIIIMKTKTNEILRTRLQHINELQEKLEKANYRFLKEAFKDRNEFTVPEFLQNAIASSSTISSIWVDYRHDGAWVMPLSIKAIGKEFREFIISGRETEEYCSDDVFNLVIYSRKDAVSFIEDFLELRIDENCEEFIRMSKEIDIKDDDALLILADEIFDDQYGEMDADKAREYIKSRNK